MNERESRRKVRIRLVAENGKDGKRKPSYQLLDQVRKKWHPDLAKARVALAWRIEYRPDLDGHLVLGKCKKTTELEVEMAGWDYVILLNKEVWFDREFGKKKKTALLDHELCHAAPRMARQSGEQKRDEKGRWLWRMRKHDIEEFRGVVERHGCYKQDLELFARALLKKREEERRRKV